MVLATEKGERIAYIMKESGIAEQVNDSWRARPITNSADITLNKRYFVKDADGNPAENVDEMYHRVSGNLAQADAAYEVNPTTSVAETENRFFNVMRAGLVVPNSPTLMNAGARLQQLAACFVLPVRDSIEDIFDSVKQTAIIHKSGGGTGFSFSELRPKGDLVGSTGGIASGPVGFIGAFDKATDVVKQGGTRRGANMAVLAVDHPDILEFIHSKDSGSELQNFNISVGVTTAFMDAVQSNSHYDLRNPRNGECVGRLYARDVFQQLAESAHRTGDPGVVFLDYINAENPNPHLGLIESVNPCGEQPLLPNESCNLGSINLSLMVTYPDVGPAVVNYDLLDEVCGIAVHMLDNVIDVNRYPTPDVEAATLQTRRIGVGVMGLAEMLFQLGLAYDSAEAIAFARELMRTIQASVHKYSGKLAKQRGPYPAWDGSTYAALGTPMRNTAPVTIAPTGTISIIAGTSSGIEPLFGLSFERNVMDGTRMVESNPFFRAAAEYGGFYSEELMQQVALTGSVNTPPVPGVPDWAREIFKVTNDIDPSYHVRMQAAFQAYTDNAVSKTINLPHEATVETIAEIYQLAYDEECKGITVYRDGSKSNQVLSTGQTKDPTDAELANDNAVVVYRPSTRERPKTTYGLTERTKTGHGNLYTTINFDDESKPFELFATVGKAGGCDSAMLEAISRLISLCLRSEIDPMEVVRNLRGITCCPAWDDGGQKVLSVPDGLAQVLQKFVDVPGDGDEQADETRTALALIQPWEDLVVSKGYGSNGNGNGNGYHPVTPKVCPDCYGELVHQEGCVNCKNPRCGWQKC